jgi:CRP/FNR family transcriptional regulator, nitrogen oxide reductase regulator
MATQELTTIFDQCFFLQGLTERERQIVLENGRLHHVAVGEFFFHQGEDALTLYVIASGRVKLSQVTLDGQQVIVDYFGVGNGLGIIVALTHMEYPLSAEAVEACTAVAWHRDTMKDLMRQHAQLAFNGIEMIGRRFVQLQERFQEVATQRVEQRIARALLRIVRQFGKHGDGGILIDMPLSRQDLAEMTGTNLYNVSRIMSKWEQAGIINSSRKQIVLCKAHELVMIAEDLA